VRPYQLCCKEELILRDCLTIDRTILANERTFLAYIRTALALFVAGMSFKFIDSLPMTIGGCVMVPVGVVVLVIGVIPGIADSLGSKSATIREILWT